jgi:hypothetical protein
MSYTLTISIGVKVHVRSLYHFIGVWEAIVEKGV